MSLFSHRSEAVARASFEILVREHHRGVLAYARSLVDDNGAAEDLVQDAFLVAWRKLEQFDTGRDFGTWVRGIVRFEYLHWARKKKLVPLEDEILDAMDRMHSSSKETSAERDVIDAVRQCVAALPDTMRRAVESVYAIGLDRAEVAEREGATEAAIRKRLQRAREQLAVCIEQKTGLDFAG